MQTVAKMGMLAQSKAKFSAEFGIVSYFFIQIRSRDFLFKILLHSLPFNGG
jgi:hypothetical protein